MSVEVEVTVKREYKFTLPSEVAGALAQLLLCAVDFDENEWAAEIYHKVRDEDLEERPSWIYNEQIGFFQEESE